MDDGIYYASIWAYQGDTYGPDFDMYLWNYDGYADRHPADGSAGSRERLDPGQVQAFRRDGGRTDRAPGAGMALPVREVRTRRHRLRQDQRAVQAGRGAAGLSP